MLNDIRMAANEELVSLNDATIALNRNTKILCICWLIFFLVSLFWSWSLTPSWLLLLGLWLGHEIRSNAIQRHYEFKLTSYMFNQLKFELMNELKKH